MAPRVRTPRAVVATVTVGAAEIERRDYERDAEGVGVRPIACRLAADVRCVVEIDPDAYRRYSLRAIRNATHRAKIGPLTVRCVTPVRWTPWEPV